MQGRRDPVTEVEVTEAMHRCSSLSSPSWDDIVLEVSNDWLVALTKFSCPLRPSCADKLLTSSLLQVSGAARLLAPP